MRPEDWIAVNQRFDLYHRGFAAADGRLPQMLQLKLDHSRRVAEDMRLLALDLGWDDGGTALAASLGLIHDIGRFEQFARYGTFKDECSVDHGACGARIAAEAGILDGLPPSEVELMTAAIRFHNVRKIPELDSSRTMDCLRLVRDADKLDIYRVLYDAWRSGVFRAQPEILHGVDVDGPPTAAALDDLQARRTISFRNVRSLADFFLMQASWVYDINYPAAARRLRDRGCLDRIEEILPDTAPIRRCLAESRRHLAVLAAG